MHPITMPTLQIITLSRFHTTVGSSQAPNTRPEEAAWQWLFAQGSSQDTVLQSRWNCLTRILASGMLEEDL